MMNTVKLFTDLLRSGEHAILFCASQQFAARHILFCAHKPRHDDALSSSSLLTSKDTFTVSAASLTLAVDASQHLEQAARKSCTFATAVEFARLVKEHGIPLAVEEKKVDCKQFASVIFTLPPYKIVPFEIESLERDQRTMVAE